MEKLFQIGLNMKKFLFFLTLCCALFNNCKAQEQVFFETLPTPVNVEESDNNLIPRVAWYRWTTKNFTIHSIDKRQGEYLFRDIEKIKSWTLTRWGLPDINFTTEARIFCAPDKETMVKLFNLDYCAWEVLKDKNENKINYLWIILDGDPAEILPAGVTSIALKEIEVQYDLKFNWWVYRAIPALNNTLPQIKQKLISIDPFLKKDSAIFYSKSILETTEERWNKFSKEHKDLFDQEAMYFCLLARKEFGESIFHKTLYNASDKVAVNILGFSDFSDLDKRFYSYIIFLNEDIRNNKTPDSYLKVKKPKESR